MASGLAASVLVAQLAIAQTTVSTATPQSSNSNALAEKQGVSAIDADLADRVRRTVAADRYLSSYAAKISVVAQDGKIRLSGLVQNEGEKAQIGSKAAAIVGARRVVNELEILPAAAAATAANSLRDLLQQASEPRRTAVAAN
jgi:osmotically-inducible protein OsmY